MKRKNLFTYIIVLIILGLSIGYSAFQSELLVDDIIADVRIESDIRITGMTYNNSTNEGTSTYSDYSAQSVLSSVNLPNESSIVTYKITVTNFGNAEMVLYDITGLPSNLEYEVQGYTLDEKICDSSNKCSLGAIKDFYLTIKYKEGGFDSTNTTYNLNLVFGFKQYIEVLVTYDYNFLPNNKIETYYDTCKFLYCCGTDANGNLVDTFYNNPIIETTSEGITYTVTRGPLRTGGKLYDRGFYFINKNSATPLEVGKIYSLIFEVRGSENFTAIIGSEQGGIATYRITPQWQRYSSSFTAVQNTTPATGEALESFVVYDWASATGNRTIQIRNIQIQDGAATVYTKSTTLRADKTLGTTIPTAPTRNSCTFAGWYTDPINRTTQVTSSTIVPKQNVTYYAHWDCTYSLNCSS